ncbi:g7373 [Coccomyxa elongata]
MTNTVIIFVKHPASGAAKTRLARNVGEVAAAEWYRVCAEHVVRTGSRLPGSRCIVACPPALKPSAADNGVARVQKWLGPIAADTTTFEEQALDENLGNRMYHALHGALQAGSQKAVLIGSDIPDICESTLAAAFTALDEHDVVFGPAVDGGYYLVGASRLHPDMFQGITWSTGTVLHDNSSQAVSVGLKVASCSTLPVLRDIDTIDDLQAWLEGLEEHPHPKRDREEETAGKLPLPFRDVERPSRTVGLQHGQSTLTGGVKNATHRYDLPPPPLAVRNLVQQAQFAHLCTVMSGMHHRRAGYPFGTLVDFAADEAGYPIFCLSPLAIHTRNIMEDPRCSLVVQMPGWTGLANARVTIFGDVYQLPQHLQEPARDIFLHKQATEKKNRWVSGNYMFFRMHRISDIYFVGGFGTVQWVDVAEYVSAKPDEIVTSDPHHTLQVLNETYSEGLRQALSRPGSTVDDAAFISIDRLGADVRTRRATDYIVERLTFPTHVHTLDEALTAMKHLLDGHSLLQRV